MDVKIRMKTLNCFIMSGQSNVKSSGEEFCDTEDFV